MTDTTTKESTPSSKDTLVPGSQALPTDSALTLIQAGRTALSRVPKLNSFMLMGFIITFVLFLVLSVVSVGGLYYYILFPISEWAATIIQGEGMLADLLGIIAWVLLHLTQFVLLVATVLLTLILTLSMMGLWFEAMCERIIAFWRPDALTASPFDYKRWLKSLGKSLADAVWLIALAAAGLLVGFVPLIGPPLSLGVEGYILGREVRDPYLVVREGLEGNPKGLRTGLRIWTLKIGLVPALVALVPVIGWLALPLAMIYMVAGFAWRGEEALAGGRAPGTP